jgi:hypothetical protein
MASKMSAAIACHPVRLRYFLRIPNVGDRINPAIVSAISRRPTIHAADTAESHLVAIGSTMAATTRASHVWGTGVMHPDFGIGGVGASHVHAVRGKLSHSALRVAGIEPSDIPLGDPGFLAPALLGIARTAAETGPLGVVPHYVDRRHPHFRRLVREQGTVELNVHDDPEQFLRDMAGCAAIVSSSLHGLVFAEALGIPNLWVTASNEIAGGSFKFDDWFSTTARPQQTAHVLSSADSIEALRHRAALHDCTIDTAALIAAFPAGQLDEMCDTRPRVLVPVETCRARPTPVFLISYNRGAMLRKTIQSIQRLERPTEIVVHDNGSTDPSTLSFLQELENGGTRVVRNPAIASADDLNQVDATVRGFFRDWAEPARYVVSDGDIDMTIAAPEALDVYDELLNTHRQVECVGPMLRIADIPAHYPLFNRVLNRHIEQFWNQRPDWTETSFGPVAHLHTGIDTTFALQRAGEPFRRLKEALRVYEPYEAQHLDWYIDDIGGDVYATTSSAEISHWNNSVELERHQHVELEHASYFVVRRNEAGALAVFEEPIVRHMGSIRPFADATDAERAARISHTDALRDARGTDVERWRNPASHYEAWQQRGKLLAGFVRPGERVFEFGAGRSVLPAELPAGCRYVGSDAAPLKAGVVTFDLNAPTLVRIQGHDVAVFSGVLEYVHDLGRLTAFLSSDFRSVVCSYAAMGDGSPEEIGRRRYSGWVNDVTVAEFCALFQRAGYRLTQQAEWSGQTLFRWDRN